MSAAQDLYRAFQDHQIFCRESLRIVNKQGVTVNFDLQPAQTKLHKAVLKQRAASQPVRIIYLKPRRVMISAGTAAEFFHEIPFTPGQHGMVVAHDLKAAKEVWRYYRDFNNKFQPFRGIRLPKLAIHARNKGVIEWENGSSIEIATARNLDSGRSFGLRFLQMAEYAFYPDARRVGQGLLNAVADDPGTMIVKESTANGVGNPFHRDWLDAVDPTGGSGWEAVFFAWFEHPEYTMPFRSHDDARRFQDSLTKDEAELWETHSLTLEQMQWRRWAIKNKCAGSVETFHQEYPSTPEEAFLYSGRPRFSHQHLSKMPVIQDAPCGELVELPGPQPRLIFQVGERGPLVVYKRPQPGRRYVAGADISEGIDVGDGTIGGEDPDYSVMSIFDADTGEQVAKLRGRLEPSPFADYAVAVLRWYNYPFLVPEANGPGLAFLEHILRLKYPVNLIYHRYPEPDEQFTSARGTKLQLLGWRESSRTRPQLISALDQYIREMGVILRDPNTVAEHFSFVIKASGRAEHQDNCHDDEVFAVGLSVIGLQHPPPDTRTGRPGNRPPGLVGVSQYGRSRQLGQQRRRG